MDAFTKVQNYLGYQVSEVREWAFVYWVRPAFGGRPTMVSKRIVDRSADIRVGFVGADIAAKDERTGKTYLIRKPGNWTGAKRTYSIKEVKSVSAYSTFDNSIGLMVGEVAYTAKPSTVREIMITKAIHVQTWMAA